jgi:hypothetical protein
MFYNFKMAAPMVNVLVNPSYRFTIKHGIRMIVRQSSLINLEKCLTTHVKHKHDGKFVDREHGKSHKTWEGLAIHYPTCRDMVYHTLWGIGSVRPNYTFALGSFTLKVGPFAPIIKRYFNEHNAYEQEYGIWTQIKYISLWQTVSRASWVLIGTPRPPSPTIHYSFWYR